MLGLDSVWLGLVAPKFYQAHIGHILAKSPNFVAAGAFYLIYILGLVYFVIEPSLSNDAPLKKTLLEGALFGLVCYATYDLTNQATVHKWPVIVTVVDLLWGSFLAAATCAVSIYVIRKMMG